MQTSNLNNEIRGLNNSLFLLNKLFIILYLWYLCKSTLHFPNVLNLSTFLKMAATVLQFYANNSITFIPFFFAKVLWVFFIFGILLFWYSQYVYVWEKHHDSMCKWKIVLTKIIKEHWSLFPLLIKKCLYYLFRDNLFCFLSLFLIWSLIN